MFRRAVFCRASAHECREGRRTGGFQHGAGTASDAPKVPLAAPHDTYNEADRIMPQGLALPALAKEAGTPAFFSMVEHGLLDAPMFAVWLSPDPVAEPAGHIHFGGHDRSRYVGAMHELPVISTKYWTVALTGAAVGDYRLPGLAADGAIMDSGTTMITASDVDATAINQARSFPCLSHCQSLWM